MNDRFRDKRVFWALVLALLALTAVPSSILLQALRDYSRFLTGFEPAPLRPIQVVSTPRHEAFPEAKPPLHFVEFKLQAPKAGRVEVVGEFNGWKAGTLALQRRAPASWQLLLPLPAGRYRYHYLVDGQVVPPPEGSVRQVP